MRVVLDTNVLVSGLLSSSGPPAAILENLARGELDVIVSPLLLGELRAVLAREKIARWVANSDAAQFAQWLEVWSIMWPDPPVVVGATPDPFDDFLLALAQDSGATCLVTGDRALLELRAARPPIISPASLVKLLEALG